MGLAGGIALASGCDPDPSCGGGEDGDGPPVANLVFSEQGSNGTAHYAQRLIGPGNTVGWQETSFGPILTDVDVGSVEFRYRGIEGRRSDAYAFAHDIEDFRSRQLTRMEQAATYGGNSWLNDWYECEPIHVVRHEWRPNHTAVRTANLLENHFYPGVKAPCGANESPPSVESAIVYDRGACARIEDIQPRLVRSMRRTWNNMFERVWSSVSVSSVDRRVMQASSWVQTGLEPLDDLRGGFSAALSFRFDLTDPLTFVDVEAVYDFRLRLTEGVLDAAVTEHLLDITSPNDPAGVFHDIEADIEEGIEDLQEELGRAQTIDLLAAVEEDEDGNLPDHGCQPVIPSASCSAIVQQIVLLKDLGAAQLEHEEGFEWTEVELEQMKEAIEDPTRWSCSGDSPYFPDPISRCLLTVPGKRLNVYPDAVEIVWFDGRETDRLAYALWVAAHASPDPEVREDAVGALCRTRHRSNPLPGGSQGLQAHYARAVLIPNSNAENLHCLECAAWDCVGCGPELCGGQCE